MDNQSYIIKNLKSNAIFERLMDWNSNSDNWLPADRYSAFATLYREFQRLQLRSQLDFYDELKGWECGLYQVLDISRREICEMLPILLTAYMYNYVRKKVPFVQRFLQTEVPSTWKSDCNFLNPNPYFIGKYPDENSSESVDTGIGKLLFQQCDVSEAELEKYANTFTFPALQEVKLTMDFPDGTSYVTKEYLLPKEGQSMFWRNVRKRNLCTISEEKVREERYSGKRFEFTPECLRTLGYRWMYITSIIMSGDNQEFSTSFACEPNLYECYRLLMSVAATEEQVETGYDSMNGSEREIAIKKELQKLFSSK